MLRAGEAVKGYRLGQIGSASLVSLAHGTNDAQKTMGVITLALIAHGNISATHFYVPFWVKLGCALAIALGTAAGGWRIINTMGNRLTSVEAPQGFAAGVLGRLGHPRVLVLRVPAVDDPRGLGRRGRAQGSASAWLGALGDVVGQMAGAWVMDDPRARPSSRAAAFEAAGPLRQGSNGPLIVGLVAAGLAAHPVRRRSAHADPRARSRPLPRRRRGRLAGPRSGAGMIPASSLVDFDALWKIMLAGFAGGAGVVLAFGFVLLGRSRYEDAGEGALAAAPTCCWRSSAPWCAPPRSSPASSR